MLGMSPRPTAWQWQAVGKHPAAADYIHLLPGTPLTQALGEWMAKGYGQWQASRPGHHESHSWRFWVKGGQKEHLVCGVMRDSSDRIGRPFPLMVLGEGGMVGWERRWPHLPLLLDKTWLRLERLAVHRYEDLAALGEDLRQLAPPQDRESDSAEVPVPPSATGEAWEACRTDLQRTGRSLMALDDGSAGMDATPSAVSRHAGLQGCCVDIPRAVFMGGTPRRTYLAVVLQPLTVNDFVNLWSVA
jgi:type VI secretion system protein VasJ